jgi:hypothetical protein
LLSPVCRLDRTLEELLDIAERYDRRRERIGIAHRGKTLSPEHKRRIAVAVRGYWARRNQQGKTVGE